MIKVLLVEDNPVDAQMARDFLEDSSPNQFSIVHVDSLAEALKNLSRDRYDAVLLDLSLPDTKGLETVTHVLATSPGVPIVILSGYDDESVGLQAVQKGAQDFQVKGQGDGAILARSIRYAIERKRAEVQLAYIAQHDSLTGLANRVLFRDRLHQALARSKRTHQPIGLMLLDLDRFKAVNDTFGHEAGDYVLKVTAVRLGGCVREVDTVSRLGGDEFTLLLEGFSCDQDLVVIAQRIIDSIAMPFAFQGQEILVGVSIGVTTFPRDDQDMDGLLKHADEAMYRAKKLGGLRYQFYLNEEPPSSSVSS